MKNSTLLILFFILGVSSTPAQNLTLQWAEPNTNNYGGSDVALCGSTKEVRLKASWASDPQCPYSGWGANRYRWTVKLYKNNVLFSTRTLQSSSCWINDTYGGINLTTGHYRANIMLEVRKPWWRWEIQSSGYTSSFIVTRNQATPVFTINGNIPDPEVPIDMCPGKIIIDASQTSCEEKYWIGIWEFDYQNWSRPLDYEWGKWFNGNAPAILNLQELSVIHGKSPTFLGNDISREGEVLHRGLLSNGTPRYYYVSVCTGFPAWDCSSALIRVKCSCP